MMVKQQQYKNIFDLKDKVAIITGGYGHLGLSMSKALASFGAKVFVMGRKGPKKVDFDGNLTFIRCDVTNPTQVKKRINDILKGNYDSKEDPKTLIFLSLWAIGFTIFWIAIGGFGSDNFGPYRGWWFVD